MLVWYWVQSIYFLIPSFSYMDLSFKEANPAYGAYDQCCESVCYVSQGVLRWTLLCMFKHLNKPNFPFFSSLLLHKMDLLYIFYTVYCW